MEDQSRETVYLGISLILMAAFFSLMVLFFDMGNKVVYAYEDQQARAFRLETQAELYKYITDGDLTATEDTISGSDVVFLITKYTTRYKYIIDTTANGVHDISYGSTLHEQYRNKYIDLMGYKNQATGRLNIDAMSTDEYYTADMALWSQSCLNEFIVKNAAYGRFIPYVLIDRGESGKEITTDIDEIIDNYNLITFYFKQVS